MCGIDAEKPIDQNSKLELDSMQKPQMYFNEDAKVVNVTSETFSGKLGDKQLFPFPAPVSSLPSLITVPGPTSVSGSVPESVPESVPAPASEPASAPASELVMVPVFPLDSAPLSVPFHTSPSPSASSRFIEQAPYLEPTTGERKQFSQLFSRNINSQNNSEDFGFYADTKLTPVPIGPSTFQVLSSRVGLDACKFSCEYLFVYHGSFTHSWSLLPMNEPNSNSSIIRPVGILETAGPHIAKAEAHITDLQFLWDAKSISVVHFNDSWHFDGCHLGFQTDDFYRYEWKVGAPSSSGEYSRGPLLYLWKTNIQENMKTLAARIVGEPLLENPTNGAPLWSLEIDSGQAPVHILLLSAFAMKACHSKLHSWFASKITNLHPPAVLLNFAFQDDGVVYNRSNKFWGDWEESRIHRSETHHGVTHEKPAKIRIIRVFNLHSLQKFAITPHVLSRINTEVSQRAAQIKKYYSIY